MTATHLIGRATRAIVFAAIGVGLALSSAGTAWSDVPRAEWIACMEANNNDTLHCCIEFGGNYTWENPGNGTESQLCDLSEVGAEAENTSPASAPVKPRPASGSSAGVTDDPVPGTPLPTPTPRPRPAGSTVTTVG